MSIRRSALETTCVYAGAVLFLLVTLAPLLWLFIMSISDPIALTAKPLQWIPDNLSWEKYVELLNPARSKAAERFAAAVGNSALVAISATTLSLVFAIPAAYGFARYKGREIALYTVVGLYMLPPAAFVLPLYTILSQLNLLNTSLALILVYCSMLLPFTTWMLKNNFEQLPYEIEQAAIVDGAKLPQLILKIVLPLALPAIGATALFAFLMAWDEFLYALIYTSDIRAKTIPVMIADFSAGKASDYALISAIGVIASLPPVLIGLLLQRTLVSGLTAGGAKG